MVKPIKKVNNLFKTINFSTTILQEFFSVFLKFRIPPGENINYLDFTYYSRKKKTGEESCGRKSNLMELYTRFLF